MVAKDVSVSLPLPKIKRRRRKSTIIRRVTASLESLVVGCASENDQHDSRIEFRESSIPNSKTISETKTTENYCQFDNNFRLKELESEESLSISQY